MDGWIHFQNVYLQELIKLIIEEETSSIKVINSETKSFFLFNDSASMKRNGAGSCFGCHGNKTPRPPLQYNQSRHRRKAPMVRAGGQHVTGLSHNAIRNCHGSSLTVTCVKTRLLSVFRVRTRGFLLSEFVPGSQRSSRLFPRGQKERENGAGSGDLHPPGLLHPRGGCGVEAELSRSWR